MKDYIKELNETLDQESFFIGIIVTILCTLAVLLIFTQIGQKPDYDPAAEIRTQDEWMKLKGQVFRRPSNPILLSVFVGAGI